jgi:signal transduction histidine kinase/ABC-type branched-subunit amino acid transport system ATPase component
MLELSGVSINFGTTSALRSVDLRVGAGELVAVSGEPGAGKSALVRCIGGDLAPSAGEIRIDGTLLGGGLRAAERHGVAVVWQDLALCENLDVAGNLLLGRETLVQMLSPSRFHARAAELLERLEIPIHDTTRIASELPGGQRRLLALAMALNRRPRLLVLDEPTGPLGAAETAAVERLLLYIRGQGIGIVLASRDIGQMFRMADRIVVLRQGRVAAELEPSDSHPDEVAGLLAGGSMGGSARRQLNRLHGLADSLARADPSSGLALIISALAAALGVERGRVNVLEPRDAPVAATAETSGRVIVQDGVWFIPILGQSGTSAVITVERGTPAPPTRDELDLMALYAGYGAAAIERQEAEVAQREAAALRRSRELQRQFLSRLSHELRTPLTAIRGYATSLAAPDIVWDRESEQRFLERIGAESARLGRLVDDLLDFSAIESGVMRLQPDWCELRLVVEAAAGCLPGDWPERVAIAGEMPVIWADHDRLEQVFVNLMNNALHHNPDGTIVRVRVRALGSSEVEVTVSDDGPGLAPELRSAPFERDGKPRSRTAGAGLGLSITRGIVEAHGGSIALAPTDEGTSFRIVLPVESVATHAPVEIPLSGVGTDG